MLPAHLSLTSAQGYSADQPVAQFELGDYKNFVYLILDHETRKTAIVDPQIDLEPILEVLANGGFTLERILLTHTHHDHVAGVPELLRNFPDILLNVHEKDLRRLPFDAAKWKGLELVREGSSISLGSLFIQVIHTPGHSSGECSYLLNAERPYLFTGDTLFIRDCGRTDFDSGNNEEMFQSLQKIKALTPETVILPGHHYREETASTLTRELKESPPLQCKNVAELAALP